MFNINLKFLAISTINHLQAESRIKQEMLFLFVYLISELAQPLFFLKKFLFRFYK